MTPPSLRDGGSYPSERDSPLDPKLPYGNVNYVGMYVIENRYVREQKPPSDGRVGTPSDGIGDARVFTSRELQWGTLCACSYFVANRT